MDILQTWLDQKGDGAAVALGTVLTGMGIDPLALVAAVEADQKATLLDDLAKVRKRAEEAGVSKDEWEKITPRLDTSLGANSSNQEEPK